MLMHRKYKDNQHEFCPWGVDGGGVKAIKGGKWQMPKEDTGAVLVEFRERSSKKAS